MIDRSVSRRQMFGFGGAAAALMLGTGAWESSSAFAAPALKGDPFTLGVASGDPTADGVVLWTRLAPDPFAEDGFGGMPPAPVRVHYEVALDERFRRVVRRDSVVASPELAHSVHPEVHGLAPDRTYWFRFKAGSEISPVGRTRTTPAPWDSPRRLRFAFASCQAWQDGYYTAYRHMAQEDLDLVVHLGDYLYEYGVKSNKRGVGTDPKFHTETLDLARYRLQYGLYKSEAPLREAHAAFPWIMTFDDHEVENNWAGETSENDDDPADFLLRRADAFQALYEHAPLRRTQLPKGPDVQMYLSLIHISSTATTRPAATARRPTAPSGSTRTGPCSGPGSGTGSSRASAARRPAGRSSATRPRWARPIWTPVRARRSSRTRGTATSPSATACWPRRTPAGCATWSSSRATGTRTTRGT